MKKDDWLNVEEETSTSERKSTIEKVASWTFFILLVIFVVGALGLVAFDKIIKRYPQAVAAYEGRPIPAIQETPEEQAEKIQNKEQEYQAQLSAYEAQISELQAENLSLNQEVEKIVTASKETNEESNNYGWIDWIAYIIGYGIVYFVICWGVIIVVAIVLGSITDKL